jgi:hypothetical protein
MTSVDYMIETVMESAAERRSNDRIDYGLFARLLPTADAPDAIPVWVVDLSSRGATLLSAFDVDDDGALLEIHLGEHPVRLPVSIRHRREVPAFESQPGPFFRLGVAFAPRLQPSECGNVLADLN